MTTVTARRQQGSIERGQVQRPPTIDLLLHNEESKTLNTEATTAEFLGRLCVVRMSELAEDCSDCGICQETYLSGPHAEQPTRLPCGHSFGLTCIKRWLQSSPKPSCPMCRQHVLEGSKSPNLLQETISLLERLVSDPNDRVSILNEAHLQAERRVAVARQEARGSRRVIADNDEGPKTAAQVQTTFKALQLADLQTSQPPDYHQWRRLQRDIEGVRQRLVHPCDAMGTLWDHRGPGITALLNPVLRPLIDDFLQKLVQTDIEQPRFSSP